MRKIFLLFFVFSIMFSMIGCQNNNLKTSSESLDHVEEREGYNPDLNSQGDTSVEQSETYFAPLTGLPVDTPINNRIIAVMVNNHHKARPQSGLNKADMVYEILSEGMITRFIALYQSNEPTVIGPVRSIRPYFLDIINGFDAIIVHAGASTAAYAMIQGNQFPDLDEITNAPDAYWRVDFRVPPHNLYTSIGKIKEVSNSKGFRKNGYIPSFIFLNDNEKVIGDSAINVTITYDPSYSIHYQFDPATKQYKRFVNGEAHMDLESNEQLTARNIIVIEAHHEIIDNEGRREIEIYGPGKGYLFQNGIAKQITWERKDGVIKAFIAGKEQGLFPGQTWMIVVPNFTNVSYQ